MPRLPAKTGSLRRTRRLTALVATVVGLGVVPGAFAHFTSTGSATASASVGTINPVTSIQAQQTGASVNVNWSAATLSSGGAVQGYSVTRSDGSTICGSPTLDTADSCSDTDVSSGSYMYTVTAVYGGFSAAATSSSLTILTAPTITAEPANPSANTTPSFSYTGGGGSGYRCSLDSAAYTSCASPEALSGLTNGSHTLSIEAVNGSSTGPAATYAWTVDNTAPSITAKPGNPSNNTSPSFSFSHTEAAYTFECKLDSGGYSACSSGKAYSGVSNGSHTFYVEAVSADGATTTPASYTWTVDTTPPSSSLSLAGSIVWTNFSSSTIGRANLDGTSPNQSFVTGATNPNGIGVDGSYVFWVNSNAGTTIGRANLNGSGANESFITGDSGGSTALAVGGSYVYWDNHGLSSIGRATINGTGVNQSFISTGAGDLRGLAVDGSYVYWADNASNSIGRANLNGTGVNPSFITGLNGPSGVAVDGSYVYWTNSGTNSIGRANLNGSSPNQTFITGANYPYGVAVNSSYVYWANLSGNTIGRANLNGSNPNESFITGADSPATVALVSSPGSAFLSGSTVYYNGNGAGSFNLTDTATDSGSSPASATFPAIATTGWTHSAETVTSSSGSAPSISYTSSAFSWNAGASTPTGYSVSSTDALGNTGSLPVTFVDDTTAPSGGALSVDASAATSGGSTSETTSTAFRINARTDYSEAQSASQSGLASSVLTVQSESLSGSTCGAPGSGGPFTTATTISGTAQPSGITVGYCYLYTLTGTDNVGNAASISTTVTVTDQYQSELTTTSGGGPIDLWLLGDPAGSTTAADTAGTSTMTANNSVDAGGTTPVTFGSVSAPSGVGGTAASFSGDGNYLSTSLPVTTSAGWALEAWMNPALSAEQTAFVLYNGDDAAGYGFGESGQHTPSSPGACIEYLAGDVGWQYNGGGCLSPGWNYVEVSSNGTGSINGVSYTFSIGAPNSPVCATTIGTELGAGCGFRNGRQFTGAIAGAAVYNHPLSASDALAHYNAGE